MVAKLKNLIARLESANSPDRELDGWIFCAVHHPTQKPSRNPLYKNREEWGVFITKPPASHTTFYDAPLYTASIDAAAALVPEGAYGFAYPWFYNEYSRLEKRCVMWRAAVHKPIWEKATPSLAGDDWFERWECIENAASPAIALCIASLKARSHGC